MQNAPLGHGGQGLEHFVTLAKCLQNAQNAKISLII